MQYLSEPSKSKYFKLWHCNNVSAWPTTQLGWGNREDGWMEGNCLKLWLELEAPRKIFARRNDKLIVKILRLPLGSLKAKCKQIFGANKNLYNVCSPCPSPTPPPPP